MWLYPDIAASPLAHPVCCTQDPSPLCALRHPLRHCTGLAYGWRLRWLKDSKSLRGPLWTYSEFVVIFGLRNIAGVPDDGVLSFCASQGECVVSLHRCAKPLVCLPLMECSLWIFPNEFLNASHQTHIRYLTYVFISKQRHLFFIIIIFIYIYGIWQMLLSRATKHFFQWTR